MASRCDDVSPLLAEKNSEEADYAAVRPAENRPTTSRTTQRRMPTSGSKNNGRQKDEASGRKFARVSSSPLQDSGRSSPSGGFPSRRRQYPFVPIQNTDRFMASQYEIPSASVDAQAFSADEGIRPRSTRMSSHLPPLVERILGKLLGIRRRGDGRNIVGTIAYSFTVLTALFFAVPGLWYTVYDIKSKFSSTTVLIGSFQIIIGFVWAVLGIYSHQLARRLFSNKNFADCVRLHSKTFLKIGVSWHTLVLGIVVVSANCYSAWDDLDTNNCRNAQVEAVVCEVFYAGRVTYAVFTLFWNFLVAYVLFSVCRTHTISLRRFQQLLMLDARLYEEQCHQHALNQQKETERTSFLSPQGLDESWFVWEGDEEGPMPGMDPDDSSSSLLHSMHRLHTYRRHLSSRSDLTPVLEDEPEAGNRSDTSVNTSGGGGGDDVFDGVENQRVGSVRDTGANVVTGVSGGTPAGFGSVGGGAFGSVGGVGGGAFGGVSGATTGVGHGVAGGATGGGDDDPILTSSGGDTGERGRGGEAFEDEDMEASGETENEEDENANEEEDMEPMMLSNEELLLTYWKFNRRFCVTSRFLQRWLFSWIAFVVIWDGYYIVYWTSHPASLPGILQFTVPLLILLLVCSAYAEVNSEAQRLVRTIFPLRERLNVIFYLGQQPITVQVFSFTLTYNAIMTVILGFFVAFASRMILDEIARVPT